MIYSDERKERLKAMEERARRELGMQPAGEQCRDRLQGVFTGSNHRKCRSGERGGRRNYVLQIVLIAAMLLLMLYLLAGYWLI